MPRHFNNFDLIRLFAATQVMLSHSWSHLKIDLGDSVLAQAFVTFLGWFPGVPIFFFISGFLIAQSYRFNPDLKQFYLKRALRIYPGLLLCFAVTFGLLLWLKQGPFWQGQWRELGFWIAAQVSIAQFYNPSFLRDIGVGAINGSLWSITVELQFYLVLPVVMLIIGRFNPRPWLPIAVLALLSYAAYWFNAEVVRSLSQGLWKLGKVTILPYLYMFLLGILAQCYFERIKPWVEGKFGHWLLAFVIGALAIQTLGYNVGSNHPNILANGLMAGVILSAAYTGNSLAQRTLRGHDLSYGIYIYHMVFVNVLLELGYKGQNLGFWYACGLTLLASALSWWLCERPALKLKPRAQAKGEKLA